MGRVVLMMNVFDIRLPVAIWIVNSFDLICKSSSVGVSDEAKYYLAKDFDKPVRRLPCKLML